MRYAVASSAEPFALSNTALQLLHPQSMVALLNRIDSWKPV